MVWSECGFVDVESALIALFRAVQIALGFQDAPQVVDAGCHVGMVGSVGVFVDAYCSLVVLLRSVQVALGFQDAPQVADADGHVWVVVSIGVLLDLNRSPEHPGGLVESRADLKVDASLVEDVPERARGRTRFRLRLGHGAGVG